MASLKDIPVVAENLAVRSGEKYVTPQGFTAIKDGQKSRVGDTPAARGGKPRWITAPLAAGAGFGAVKNIVRRFRFIVLSHSASLISRNGTSKKLPALLTSVSSPGSAATARSTSVAGADASHKSHGI